MTAFDLHKAIVIVPQGDLWEGAPCDELERSLMESVSAGRPVIVDLSGVSSLTARCLEILARARQASQERGGRILLCGAHGLQPWLIETIGLSRSLPVYGDREAALRALDPRPDAAA